MVSPSGIAGRQREVVEAAAEAERDETLGERAGDGRLSVDGVDGELAQASRPDCLRQDLERRLDVVGPADDAQRAAAGVDRQRRPAADGDQMRAGAP